MQEMIVASRLTDGLVVFLDAAGGWTEDFHRGAILADASARAAALEIATRAAADNLVVDPYPMELELRAGHPEPKALRERIRAMGPTVRSDLGKQAQGFAPTIAQRG
jgi:sulfite reductase (NADPH) hemoprotein beta-component